MPCTHREVTYADAMHRRGCCDYCGDTGTECEYCGAFVVDGDEDVHACYGTAGEARDAERLEDDHR